MERMAGVGCLESRSGEIGAARRFLAQTGDRVDLHGDPFWQCGHLDAGPRGLQTGEIGPVDTVYRLEVVEVRQKDGRSHDVVERPAGRGEDRTEVPHDLLGLSLYSALDDFASCRQRDLTTQEEQLVYLDSLGIGAEGDGSGIRMNGSATIFGVIRHRHEMRSFAPMGAADKSHVELLAPVDGSSEGDLVGELKVAAMRYSAGDPRDPDAPLPQLARE